MQDVINTGVRLKVIEQAGAYFTTPDGFKAQGKKAIEQHIHDNPKLLEVVRNGVLDVMRSKAVKPKLEVVE